MEGLSQTFICELKHRISKLTLQKDKLDSQSSSNLQNQTQHFSVSTDQPVNSDPCQWQRQVNMIKQANRQLRRKLTGKIKAFVSANQVNVEKVSKASQARSLHESVQSMRQSVLQLVGTARQQQNQLRRTNDLIRSVQGSPLDSEVSVWESNAIWEKLMDLQEEVKFLREKVEFDENVLSFCLKENMEKKEETEKKTLNCKCCIF